MTRYELKFEGTLQKIADINEVELRGNNPALRTHSSRKEISVRERISRFEGVILKELDVVQHGIKFQGYIPTEALGHHVRVYQKEVNGERVASIYDINQQTWYHDSQHPNLETRDPVQAYVESWFVEQ